MLQLAHVDGVWIKAAHFLLATGQSPGQGCRNVIVAAFTPSDACHFRVVPIHALIAMCLFHTSHVASEQAGSCGSRIRPFLFCHQDRTGVRLIYMCLCCQAQAVTKLVLYSDCSHLTQRTVHLKKHCDALLQVYPGYQIECKGHPGGRWCQSFPLRRSPVGHRGNADCVAS